MSRRLSLLVLGVILPGGGVAAGEETGSLTLVQAAQRLRQGIPVYSCAMKADWFSGVPGRCPGGGMELELVEDIQNGKAVFMRREADRGRTTNRNTMEKK
ncbi:MAG: hypothetical protein KatS3mg108_0702 [Isosphaeraceae bacterium]|jgi:hypothetical protein|nr:MAG: hypothetical protein KatS3mg108_0702 [Isosphaeraceae bacterium]